MIQAIYRCDGCGEQIVMRRTVIEINGIGIGSMCSDSPTYWRKVTTPLHFHGVDCINTWVKREAETGIGRRNSA